MADTIAVADDAANAGRWLFPVSHPRVKRIMDAAAMASLGWQVSRKAWRWYEKRNEFILSIGEDDEIYPKVHDWLARETEPAQRRSMSVVSRRWPRKPSESDVVTLMATGDYERREVVGSQVLDLYYDAETPLPLTIAGHRVTVKVDRHHSAMDAGRRWKPRPDRIIITAPNALARDAVLGWLASLVEPPAEDEPEPQFVFIARWGEWHKLSRLYPRALDTVVLPDGITERAAAALEKFRAQEGDYGFHGIPWHFGFLFEGPPGTGKTSLTRALASTFGYDLYYLPMSGVYDDAQLAALLGSVPNGAMLLLEDIDVAAAARDRHKASDAPDDRGATLSGLLNGIDGVLTPHGQVVVMTTNDPDALDAALVRPGRIDERFVIPPLAQSDVRRLTKVLCGEPVELGVMEIAAGDIVGVAKPHFGDPDAIKAALLDAWPPGRHTGRPVGR